MLARSTLASRSSGRYIVWSASIIRSSRSADGSLVQDPSVHVLASATRRQTRSVRLLPGREQRAIHVADRGGAHEPAQLVDPLADALGGDPGSDRAVSRASAIPRRRRHVAEPRRRRLAHGRGSAIDARQHARPVHVPVVAAEQLVAAVAAERHGDVRGAPAARRAASAAATDPRTARRRCPAAAGTSARASLPGQQQLRVIGSEVLRHARRVRGLVEVLLGEADGVRLDRARARLLHQGDDRGGVDPAGQQRAQRDVRLQPAARRLRQQPFELVDRLASPCPRRAARLPLRAASRSDQ